MLKIQNLHAKIGDKEILKGIDLEIKPGEVHAIMGPNGAGKSTLSAVLTGRPDYEVTEGSIVFKGKDLLAMAPEERSWAGIFLSFQYPVEIPGVSITAFMKAAINARLKAQGKPEMKAADFIKLQKEKMAFVGMNPDFAKREVNVGFSGGEKKRNEIFQTSMPSKLWPMALTPSAARKNPPSSLPTTRSFWSMFSPMLSTSSRPDAL